jgi:flagellar hook-basal body complex protein FliE
MVELGKLHMQRASGIGAWIMDGHPAIPSFEKPGFLASFAFYVRADTRLTPQAGEISGFLPSFAPYEYGRMALVSRRSQIKKERFAMPIAGLAGIENMLEQMREVVRVAQGGSPDASGGVTPAGDGFATELQRSLKRVSGAQNAAVAQAKAFELGVPNVSLNNVIVDMQKANIGFQTAVQVRNRLVEAYKEISSLSV